jgi:hypothetical protein
MTMSSGMGLRVGTSGLIALLAPGLQAVAQDNGAETQRTCEVCSPTLTGVLAPLLFHDTDLAAALEQKPFEQPF